MKMLDSLITSKTRVKLLLKFFSNGDNSAYLRALATEFGESTNSVRVELNRLSEAGLLQSEQSGKTILYKANKKNPLFPELRNMVGKYLGFDRIVDQVVKRLGDVEVALITGAYAEGQDSGIVDLVLVGDIDRNYLVDLIDKTEKLIHKKIRPLILQSEEYASFLPRLEKEKHLIIWSKSLDKSEF